MIRSSPYIHPDRKVHYLLGLLTLLQLLVAIPFGPDYRLDTCLYGYNIYRINKGK